MSTQPDPSVVRALRELGLSDNPAPSSDKTVDRSRLPRIRIHASVSRDDRVAIFELLLRGLWSEAQSLADEFERRNTSRLRVTGKDTAKTLALKRRLGLILRDGTPEQRADARRRLAELDRKMNPRRRRMHSTSTQQRKAA